jgi:hypothetical protein
MEEKDNIVVLIADESHLSYVDEINDTIQRASEERGTGIARRTFEYIADNMKAGKAIIALDGEKFAGFCYIESWGHHRFVANSGLIVVKEYRGGGLAKRIKKKAFELSRTMFPDSKIFGLTTGLPVMKINSELGYKPVTFSELTDDDDFWKGCQSCVNYDILMRTERSKCLCTAMIYDPAWEEKGKSLEDILVESGISSSKESEKESTKVIPFKKWLTRVETTGSDYPFKLKLFKKNL